MRSIRDWRGIPIHRTALKAFPRQKILRLANWIENGPGFQSEEARRRFGYAIRDWAVYALSVVHDRPAKWSYSRTPKGQRDALRELINQISSAEHCLDNIQIMVATLPLALRLQLLQEYRRSNSSNVTPDPLVRLNRDLNQVRTSLLFLNRATAFVEANAAKKVSANRPTRAIKDPVLRLKKIWENSTGCKPTRTNTQTSSTRVGAFPNFLREAVAAIFPNEKIGGGYIDEICSEGERDVLT